MSMPKVSAVVVTYNSEKDIKDCLESLVNQDYSNLEKIIVVDSASSDKTLEVISDYSSKLDVSLSSKIEVIASKKNLYFAGGNNLGIKTAIEKYGAEYVVILNPDAAADKNWISELVKIASNDDKVGIVGAKTVFWKNPNEGLLNSTGLIFDGFMQSYDRGFMQVDSGQFDLTEEIIAVSGVNMLLRVSMINKIGAFYEPLQMYMEDLELCIRAKKNGWKIIYTANSKVGHKYMQSTSQNISVRKELKLKKNWLLIALKHYKFKSKLAMIKKYLAFRIKS